MVAALCSTRYAYNYTANEYNWGVSTYRKFDQSVRSVESDHNRILSIHRSGRCAVFSGHFSFSKGDSSSFSSNITANQIHFVTFEWYCFYYLVGIIEHSISGKKWEGSGKTWKVLFSNHLCSALRANNSTTTSTASFFLVCSIQFLKLRNIGRENTPHHTKSTDTIQCNTYTKHTHNLLNIPYLTCNKLPNMAWNEERENEKEREK